MRKAACQFFSTSYWPNPFRFTSSIALKYFLVGSEHFWTTNKMASRQLFLKIRFFFIENLPIEYEILSNLSVILFYIQYSLYFSTQPLMLIAETFSF